MSRSNFYIVGVVCVWVAIITLVPLYYLSTGYLTFAKKEKLVYDRNSPFVVDGRPRSARNSPQEDGSLNKTVPSVPNSAVNVLGSSAMRREVEEAISNDEHGTNSRSAFELVVVLSSLLPKITNISRMKTPSPEAFRNHIAPVGLPVIFTDMLEGSKLSNWSWDYLKTKWGETVFHNTRQGKYSIKINKYGKHFVNRVSVKLKDFIDVVSGARTASKGEEKLYITKQRVIPPEALDAEFHYPPFYPGSNKKCYLEPTGWIGSPGTFTQGHIDSKDNYVYQIIGEKRWTIFSPQDYKYLYYTQTRGSLEWSSVLSSLDPPDLTKYPLYSKATPITFTMKPGEVLYLPRGWTHRVENVTPALMINVWRYGAAAITEYWSTKNRDEMRTKCF